VPQGVGQLAGRASGPSVGLRLGVTGKHHQAHRFHLAETDRSKRQAAFAIPSLVGFRGQLVAEPAPKVPMIASPIRSRISLCRGGQWSRFDGLTLIPTTGRCVTQSPRPSCLTYWGINHLAAEWRDHPGAPGWTVSSGMPRTATAMLKAAAPTPTHHLQRNPRARGAPSSARWTRKRAAVDARDLGPSPPSR
jgi:hypothetical protein